MENKQSARKILMKVWMEACASKNPTKTIDKALQDLTTLFPKEKDLSHMVQPIYRTPLKDGDMISHEYINNDQRIGWNAYAKQAKKNLGVE